jgi:hypothetical protein
MHFIVIKLKRRVTQKLLLLPALSWFLAWLILRPSSETSVDFQHITLRCIAEDITLYKCRCEILELCILNCRVEVDA